MSTISNREQRKRKCQMESEKDDTQQTKQSVIGMLRIGQRDSQKDLVLSKEYPPQMPIIYNREQGNKAIKNMRQTSKKPRTALDKSTDLVYNTDMKSKENKMTNKDIKLANEFWANASKHKKDQMFKSLKKAAIDGRIVLFATLEDKAKLSTYRVLATKMGFTMGAWMLRKNELTAIATIKKTT